ncbi:N-acetyltransferase [Biostraticola tofi]|uniref:Putative acetyltransferase n=1 Tax=Biostraticola tofi TaxID=466109 RepID=A0A4V2W4E0_9GAMM|nr:N-acetyltransferase [Biostraticola tofi]TCV95499.1 putative acetyltransferase [Biostraticola tofi]
MIRPLRHDDTEAVTALWLLSTTLAHPFISPAYWQESLPMLRDDCLPQSWSRTDEQHGVLTGFICVSRESYISALFISPLYHRQGIGNRLMAHAKRQFPMLMLEVYQLNRAARRFYRREGFRLIGRYRNEETGHLVLILQWRQRPA